MSSRSSVVPPQITRRILASAMSVLLVTAGLVVTGLGIDAAPAQARTATGGLGLHKGLIDWFEWGADKVEVSSPITKTNTRTIDGKDLATVCTLSNKVGQVEAYRSGTWRGDALDDLYNMDNVPTEPQLVTGLSNRTNGATVTFDIACSVTFNNVPVPLAGLVIADAESSNKPQDEYIEATPKTAAKWRIIDRYRKPGCTTQTEAILEKNTGKLRLAPDGPSCDTFGTSLADNGPMAVAFMEGSTAASIKMKGGGKSAIALGVILAVDYGDAPLSYGPSGSLFSTVWTGGEVPVGTTKVSTGSFALGTPAQPALRLGVLVDSEGAPQYSADALGDDNNGRPDEDGIIPPLINVTPGQSYTLPPVSCSGTGSVAGWIDWNRNGTFDTAERSAPVPCPTTGPSLGRASLTWTVPADTVHSSGDVKTFMRLRIAPDASALASPTGLTTAGEVEDYAINVHVPQLTLSKTSNATANSRPGDTVSYTITATNSGTTGFNAAYPARVTDDLSEVLDDAVYNADATADKPGVLSYAAPRLTFSGALAAGAVVSIKYTMVLGSGGDGVLRNVAFAGPGDTPACKPPTSGGVDSATGIPCAQTQLALPRLKIDKTASSEDLPVVGGTLDYSVKVTNTGPGNFTVAKPAAMSDDLRYVLDDGEVVNNQATSTTGSAVIEGSGNLKTVKWSGVLAAGETATISYSVKYTAKAGGNGILTNTACVPSELADPAASPCSHVQVPAAVIVQEKNAAKVISDTTTPPVTTPLPSGTTVLPNDKVRYTLVFTTTGASRGLIDSTDDLSGVLDDATFETDSLVASGGVSATFDQESKKLHVTGLLPAGQSATVSYTVTVKSSSFGDAALGNYLLRTGEIAPATCDASTKQCTVNPVKGQWTLEKAAAPGTGNVVSPEDTISYAVTAKGQGGPVQGVVLKDDLSGLLENASFVSGTATLTINQGPATAVADPAGAFLTTTAFDLGINATATLTYKVKVKANAWSATLVNTVNGLSQGSVPPIECQPCTTTHPVTSKVLLTKIGENEFAQWVPMKDSAWKVYQDDGGKPGSVLTVGFAEIENQPGQFQLLDVPADTYWLEESHAPKGFNLLAQRVKFTVASNGTVTLGTGAADGVVSVSAVSTGDDAGRYLITVRDVPALALPESGGAGTLVFTVGGSAIMVSVILLIFLNRRRTRSGGSMMA